MNVIAANKPRIPTRRAAACLKCGDFGFTGIQPDQPDGWTAGHMYKRGVACSCAAGAQFAELQMEWLKPFRHRETGQEVAV